MTNNFSVTGQLPSLQNGIIALIAFCCPCNSMRDFTAKPRRLCGKLRCDCTKLCRLVFRLQEVTFLIVFTIPRSIAILVIIVVICEDQLIRHHLRSGNNII